MVNVLQGKDLVRCDVDRHDIKYYFLTRRPHDGAARARIYLFFFKRIYFFVLSYVSPAHVYYLLVHTIVQLERVAVFEGAAAFHLVCVRRRSISPLAR